ncbi:MAG: thiamine pyrophosphate-dependent enzyme [Candidatus Shapirobacteria bacterium]
MLEKQFNTRFKPTWCPGCGNFGIWLTLKKSFVQLKWQPGDFGMVYDIGCSGNMSDFLQVKGSFHSLHGRAIPTAVGMRLADPHKPVVVVVGDGGAYGEGGNHLLSACRGNFDLTVLVHDNRVYGLTTGQATPTSPQGYQSKSTPDGLIETPLEPLALAISQGASFVAQAFAGDPIQLNEVIVSGIKHPGFSLINILQPCVTFNPVNTYDYYRERVYKIDRSFADKKSALNEIMDNPKIPTGVIYCHPRPTYESQLPPKKAFDFQDLLEEFK